MKQSETIWNFLSPLTVSQSLRHALLPNIPVYPFGFEPFRDRFLLAGFTNGNNGKWLDMIRKVK